MKSEQFYEIYSSNHSHCLKYWNTNNRKKTATRQECTCIKTSNRQFVFRLNEFYFIFLAHLMHFKDKHFDIVWIFVWENSKNSFILIFFFPPKVDPFPTDQSPNLPLCDEMHFFFHITKILDIISCHFIWILCLFLTVICILNLSFGLTVFFSSFFSLFFIRFSLYTPNFLFVCLFLYLVFILFVFFFLVF